MIWTIMAAVAVAGLSGWILRPLFKGRGAQSDWNDALWNDAVWNDLVDSKHAVLRSILDLEFDHKVGKVADADYEDLRRQHESEALAILGQMDEMGPATPEAPDAPPADQLEREIAAARKRLRSGG